MSSTTIVVPPLFAIDLFSIHNGQRPLARTNATVGRIGHGRRLFLKPGFFVHAGHFHLSLFVFVVIVIFVADNLQAAPCSPAKLSSEPTIALEQVQETEQAVWIEESDLHRRSRR